MRRLLALAFVVLAAAALAALFLFLGKKPAPPVVLPGPPAVVEAPARPANIHRLAEAEGRCAACHTEAPALKADTSEALCRGCHAGAHAQGSHPVDLVIAAPVALPLAEGQRMTCLTCHDPHGTHAPMMREGGSSAVCGACHGGK